MQRRSSSGHRPAVSRSRWSSDRGTSAYSTRRSATGGATRALLHPQLLYRLFRNVWQGALPLRHFLDRAVDRPWVVPGGEDLAGPLPEEFTAVRFYFRESFPDTPENRALVRRVVERLAQQRPVVLLNPGIVVDEHVDAEPAEGPRVSRPLAGVAPARNLYAQAAVVARARLFVGHLRRARPPRSLLPRADGRGSPPIRWRSTPST